MRRGFQRKKEEEEKKAEGLPDGLREMICPPRK